MHCETMFLSKVLEKKKALSVFHCKWAGNSVSTSCAQSDHLCSRASQGFLRAADFPHENYGIMGKITKWGSWESWERPDGRTDLGSHLCCVPVDSSYFFQPFFPPLWDGCLRFIVRWWGTSAPCLAYGTSSMYVGFCSFLFHDLKK